MGLFLVDRDKSRDFDQIDILYQRKGQVKISTQTKQVRTTFTDWTPNPDRVTLLSDGSKNGLRVYYYRYDNRTVKISGPDGFVRLHESMVIPVEQALKKYRKRKFDPPKTKPTEHPVDPPNVTKALKEAYEAGQKSVKEQKRKA